MQEPGLNRNANYSNQPEHTLRNNQLVIEETIRLSDPNDNPVQQANFDAEGNRKDRKKLMSSYAEFISWMIGDDFSRFFKQYNFHARISYPCSMCFQMLVPMGHAFDKTPTYDHKFHIGQYHSYLGGFGTNYLLLQM